MTKRTIYTSVIFFLFPLVAGAQLFELAMSSFSGVVGEAKSILDLVQPILITGSFIVFFWGLTKFVINATDSKELAKGRKYMAWSILVLFVLLTYRTLMTIVSSDLEIGDSKNIPFLKTDAVTPVTGGRVVDPGVLP